MKPKPLSELIDELKSYKSWKSLPDDYLEENGYLTRKHWGIGEYCYGIVFVAEDWVLPYLEELQSIKEGNTKND